MENKTKTIQAINNTQGPSLEDKYRKHAEKITTRCRGDVEVLQ